MTLEDVLEVAEVDTLPGDAGPLTFVAFVRRIPPGKSKFEFVVRPGGEEEEEIARLPLEVDLPAELSNRQLIVRMHIPTLPAEQGGWFDLYLEWQEEAIAKNRFAIGTRSGTPPKEEAPNAD